MGANAAILAICPLILLTSFPEEAFILMKGWIVMRLHFPWHAVEQTLETLRTAGAVRTLYDQDTDKGFWLVGDQGVYLMPNTVSTEPVIYARECDPVKLDFDTWWQNKRASFGADDGVEFLPMEVIENLAAALPEKPQFLVVVPKENTITIGFK